MPVKEMKILFWVPYPTAGASNRYRVEQYIPYLKENAIEPTLRPFWSEEAFAVLYKKGNYFKKIYFFALGLAGRFFDLLRISKYDGVFIHRESCPVGFFPLEAVLSFLKKPYIFDFDDAIFLRSTSRQNSFIERFKNYNRIGEIINKSSCAIAGNSYLADFARRHNPNIVVIPTCIDTQKYAPSERLPQDHPIVIGWIGSITTLEFLYSLKEVFESFSARHPRCVFKIIGGSLKLPDAGNIVNKPWSKADEILDLQSFDIGIMPMPDNGWTRGKCGFKAILYMSMGIPVICSPVGVNSDIISDGVNGFLASTPEEWLKKLEMLITDTGLRKKIGEAGRLTVERKYSLKVNQEKFLEILFNFKK